ncbi:MAG: hypothetical protein DRP93_03465, partial [Candidatus Neomarinimicrobiota bacterium]
MILSKFKKLANLYGKEKTPFLFLIDFEMKKPLIFPLNECDKQGVYFQIPGSRNVIHGQVEKKPIELDIFPIKKKKYAKSFSCAQVHLNAGNTYLLNITFPTPIKTDEKIDNIINRGYAELSTVSKRVFSNEEIIDLTPYYEASELQLTLDIEEDVTEVYNLYTTIEGDRSTSICQRVEQGIGMYVNSDVSYRDNRSIGRIHVDLTA